MCVCVCLLSQHLNDIKALCKLSPWQLFRIPSPLCFKRAREKSPELIKEVLFKRGIDCSNVCHVCVCAHVCQSEVNYKEEREENG